MIGCELFGCSSTKSQRNVVPCVPYLLKLEKLKFMMQSPELRHNAMNKSLVCFSSSVLFYVRHDLKKCHFASLLEILMSIVTLVYFFFCSSSMYSTYSSIKTGHADKLSSYVLKSSHS